MVYRYFIRSQPRCPARLKTIRSTPSGYFRDTFAHCTLSCRTKYYNVLYCTYQTLHLLCLVLKLSGLVPRKAREASLWASSYCQ